MKKSLPSSQQKKGSLQKSTKKTLNQTIEKNCNQIKKKYFLKKTRKRG